MKGCTICGEIKPFSEFHKQADRADGHCSWCKPCKAVKKREEYERTRDRVLARRAEYRRANPEKCAEAKRGAYRKRPDHYRAQHKARYEQKKDEILAQCAEYRARTGPQKSARDRAYVRRRMATDGVFRMTYAVRNRIFQACRDHAIPQRSKTAEMLGCDWQAMKGHLETQFRVGMTWDNYGEWHVDHVIPLASAATEADVVRLCHYTNLQPLWARDNLRKGAKVPA